MPHCIFCDRASLGIIAENELAFAIRDKFPVRPLHTLILPKRHDSDGLTLSDSEISAIFELSRQMRNLIKEEDSTVAGFNFGLNYGLVAGQKILHAHFYLIPRRVDEAPPPPAQA